MTHPPAGCALTPAKCTRRHSTSTKSNMYNRLKVIVSAVKKFVTRILFLEAKVHDPARAGV